jgi:hypothetical protein
MRPLLAVALLAALAPAAPVPKSLKKADDASRIVGTWKPTDKESAWFQFNDDRTLKTWHGAEGGAAHSHMDWKWALDPDTSHSPRKVRLTRVPDSENGYDCLYELDGDTLRLVLLLSPGVPPPKKVEAGPNLQLHQTARHTPAK